MKPYRIELAVVAVFFAGVGAFYYWYQAQSKDAPAAQADATPAAPPARAEPFPRYPVPSGEGATTPDKPLPALNDSDPEIGAALAALLGLEKLGQFFRPEEIVRHIVVTIDNLPRQDFSQRLSPVHPPAAPLKVTGKDGDYTLSPANDARYVPYVRLAETVDSARLVSLYVRYYPLFQKAYEDLGFPGRYFNDRLVEVIDHLLAVPEVRGPVKLVTPHVLYEFADPELEARSAGQKIMIRIGAENSQRIKAKLRDLRRELLGKVAEVRGQTP